jgi:GH15 family glucan-1,4-alpha-glucosidase
MPNDPADRDPRGFVPLESYAVVGDGRTVAVIAADGDVDWFPPSRLDGPPVFAALLDPDGGGRIRLHPSEPARSSHRYVPGTNVLETTWVTESGSRAVVTDALLTGVAGALPWTEFARRVRSEVGAVPFEWQVSPGGALQGSHPEVEQSDGHVVVRVAGVTIAVDAAGGVRWDGSVASGSFTAEPGSDQVVSLTASEDQPLTSPVPTAALDGVDETIRRWRDWSDHARYDGPWSDDVRRSALALKLLVDSDSGAIAAAATTSLPERLSGGKNWDYRFAWLRDLSYTVRALRRFGLREETHAALAWTLRVLRSVDDGTVPIFRALDGSAVNTVDHRDAPGWRDVGPVVAGNRASGQLQLSVYGDVLDIVREFAQQGNTLDAATARLLPRIADEVVSVWNEPDSGIWELQDLQHYTSSKMGCWQALDAAVDLHQAGFISGDLDTWRSESDRIRDWVRERCWDESRGSYVMYPGADALDASILRYATGGFDDGPRMSRSIDALASELGSGALLYRYTGMSGEEGTFVACAFWRVSALAAVGRVDEATDLMDELVVAGNEVGLFSEMIAEDGTFLGNLPQALSHLSLIDAAITIERVRDGDTVMR